MSGCVEKIHRALDVDLAVNERVLNAVADGGHGGKVGDSVGSVFGDELAKTVGLAEIAEDEGESFFGVQVGEMALFVFERVVIVHVVEADDFVAALEEGFGEPAADESGCAG